MAGGLARRVGDGWTARRARQARYTPHISTARIGYYSRYQVAFANGPPINYNGLLRQHPATHFACLRQFLLTTRLHHATIGRHLCNKHENPAYSQSFAFGGSYAPSYLGWPFGSRLSCICLAGRGAGGGLGTGHRQRTVGLGCRCGRAAAPKKVEINAGEKAVVGKPGRREACRRRKACRRKACRAAEKPPAGKGPVAGPRPRGKELEPPPKTKKDLGERRAAEKPAREKVIEERAAPEERAAGRNRPLKRRPKRASWSGCTTP